MADSTEALQNTQRFLDFLGRAEGADYNTIVGGKRFSDFGGHPNVVGLTTPDGPSTAAGKYQITKTTYDDYAPKLGITDFSPESQDRIAVAIMQRNGALQDVQNGDFTGAINKLGGIWASLPSSKYGQGHKSWDWVKTALGVEGGLSPQFTTGSEVTPSYGGPSASELYRLEEQQADEYGGVWNNIANTPRGVSLGFQVDNSVYNWWQERGISQTDPDFRWDDGTTEQYLRDIPERYWDYIMQSKSSQEAEARRSRLQDTMQKEQELARMGVAGFGGRLVGNLVDIPTLISFVPGMGEAALLSKTSRIANAVRMGLLGAGTNVAWDAATMSVRPTSSVDDLYMSAAMGLGLGAGVGLAVNPARIARSGLEAETRDLQNFGIDASARAQTAEIADLIHPNGRENFLAKVDTALGKVKGLGPDYDRIDRAIVSGDDRSLSGSFRRTDDGDVAVASRVADDGVAQKIRDEVSAIPKRDAEGAPTYTKTYGDPGTPKGPGASARAMLEDLKGSKDPLIATLAGRLADQLGDDVKIVMKDANYRSNYNPGTHIISLRSTADDSVKLHEIAHAVTANRIRFGMANPDTVHGELTRQLQDIFKEVKEKSLSEKSLDSSTRYYLKNLDEFMAGIYSGKSEFIDFLARTKVNSGQSVLSRVVDTIRKLLGMDPNETNALTKALGITDKLIDQPLNVEMNLVNNRTQGRRQVKFHMEPSASVDQGTVDAANKADIPTVFGWGLGLENKLGGAKAPDSVRALASKLFGTTIGYKDHSVVKANAWDDTLKWADGWAVEMRKGTYPVFEKWFKESGRPWHQKGQAYEEFGTEVSNYIRGVQKDYAPEVVKAGEHMRGTLAKVVDYINNPLFDEGRVKKGLTQTELRDAETGETKLVGELEKNPNYLPRKHDINKWNSVVNNFGRDAVEGWWARAYQAGREGVSDEAAAKWAKWYVRTVEEAHANRSQDLLDDMMRGQDKQSLKDSLVINGGYTEAEAYKIMDDMLPTKATDTGRTLASLKHRNTIDETHTETWTTKDGEKLDIGLNDFIHSNAFEVVEPYLRRMAGSVSLAKHLDIYKNSDIGKRILEATTNKLGEGFAKPSDLASLRKDLQFTFDRIQGLPQEEFTALNKSLEMWRNFNVIRLMGGAVWNQMIELSQIVGSMGWKTTSAAVPELRALRRDIATGKAPNDILDHLENTIGGVGSEYIGRMEFKTSDDWVRHKGDTAYNRWLDRTDTASKKLAKGVLDYTGMTPLMIQQKRVHAVALVNHFVNTANGSKSSFLTRDRLAWMGMDEGDYAKVLKGIKDYTKPAQGEFGKSFKMDFDGWQKADPESYSKFMTAIHRETRRVIQENDLSSMIPLMGSTLGKTVFQFMNFSMHGWNKSMLFAMNHRDWSTLSTVLHGALFASLAYIGRTMLNSAGMDPEKRQEFLDKRMSVQQIVANSFGRLSQASLLPNIYDTVSPYPMFSGMRTTSDLSSLASNPTYQAINGLISMKKIIRNAASDEYQTTSKDVRQWGNLVPLNNVFPVSTLLNALANDYPSTETQQ